METNVILYGASGHGKVIIDILKNNGVIINAIIDDNPKINSIMGLPVIQKTNLDFSITVNIIISIGNNKIRKLISNQMHANYITAIHSSAIISNDVKLGNGTVIMAGVIINPDTTIGNHCIINTGAVVEHDCCIADFVHISPSVALAGSVIVGEGTHIGIGAKVIQSVKIGKWVTIGAGAIIIKDVPDYAVVVGNPGKIIKFNQENE
jgi:sugar O-acyltransferase (sialic acid O-acetyltransferase NeuD family)